MSQKIKVGIIFGGKSAEHEVSLQSAKNIVDAMDKNKYEIILIGIDKKGKWHLNEESKFLLHDENPKLIQLNKTNKEIAIVPGKNEVINYTDDTNLGHLDVIFPVLHGTLGEDGTIQGMLRLADIPYVGPNILGAAVCMDKDVAKRLLKESGIDVAKSITYRRRDITKISFQDVMKTLSLPVFIKPANQGSSVGVSKVKDEEGFKKAIEEAFQYDHKVLIEENIVGREVECSILGNDNPIPSLPGEILPKSEFYSYETKYIDENGATLEIPAKLDKTEIQRIQRTAIRAYETLECEGMARVDFFLCEDGRLVLNEVNTIPGFTKISMYPKLWEVSGLSYSNLIDKLIHLAIERYTKDKGLKSSIE